MHRVRSRSWSFAGFVAAAALASLGCPSKSRAVDAGAAPASTAAVASDGGAAPVPIDPPEGGSVYFANIGKYPYRIYFDRSGAKLAGFVIELQDWAQPDVFQGDLEGDHRFRLISKIARETPPDDRIVVEGTFVPGRGLTATRRWAKNDPQSITPLPFEWLSSAERTFEGSFAGVMGERTRVRAKLRAVDGKITGVYRYTSSKTDLRLAGTLDTASRRVSLTETSSAGAVTGRFEGLVVSTRALAGVWSSPDGARRLPFRLYGDEPYPEIQTFAGGVRVVPQETYRSTKDGRCVEDGVFPEISGLSPELAKKVNHEWKRRAYLGMSPDENEQLTWESLEKRLATPLPEADCVESSVTENRYALLSLGKTLLAVEFAHYAQFDGISGTHWSDCGVSDLESGEIVELQKIMGAEGRDKLGELVRQWLHREAADAGIPEYDDIYSEVREDTSLCMTPAGVRVMIYGHRVFGPEPQVLPYASVAPLFPAGKYRQALTR